MNTDGAISAQLTQPEPNHYRRQDDAQNAIGLPQNKLKVAQVYCDGACKPNPGAVYIGVYCAEPVIHIARRIEEYGTNNVAECLAAIAALEECKKLGLFGLQLMSDSTLMIEWTSGSYKWGSSTPFEYVPKIRKLLKEVQGQLIWVPTKKNLADKLSKSLIPTALDKQLASLKSGRDEFSKMKKTDLIDLVGLEKWTQITSRIDKEQYQLTAARWHLRGLSLDTAI